MNKKGFTLIEMMAALIILSAVALIAIPAVLKSVKNTKQDAYNMTITNIKLAMQNWKNNHPDSLPQSGSNLYLTVAQLKHEGYLAQSIINPITEKPFPNDTLLIIRNDTTGYQYNIDINSGTETEKYDTATPYFTFNTGQIKRTIKVGESYVATSAIAHDGSGGPVDVTITTSVIGGGSVSTNSPGIYHILYKATVDDVPISMVETLVVEPVDAVCRVAAATTNGVLTVGDRYTCNPGDEVARNFYILSVRSSDVLLIMDRNLGGNIAWSTDGTIDNGATAADSYLKMVTKSWSNVTTMLPDATMIANAAGYASVAAMGSNTLSGWLYANLKCNVNTCTEFYNNDDMGLTSGYWTSTSSDSNNAYGVDGNGKIATYSNIDNNYYGIRPVIAVPKNKLIN